MPAVIFWLAMRTLTIGNMYPPHHLGGYELIWRAAVWHLRARGDQVRVVTTDHLEHEPDPGIDEDPDVHRELRWYWRAHEVRRLGLRPRLALERHNLAVLDRQLAQFRPDAAVVWSMGGMSLSLLERLRRAGVPTAAVVIDEWPVYAPRIDGWQRSVSRPPFGHLAQLATGVPTVRDLGGTARWVFASAYLRERAVAAGLAVDGAEVIHPGVDPQRFRAAAEREWRGELLSLGRIESRKGIATAIGALASLPDCNLRCIGRGDPAHRAELGAYATRLGVGGRVSFDRLGRDRVPSAIAAADALLFTATWPEPFGLVPLEAMAVGRPVVATATGGAAEYLRDGYNCLQFAAADQAALAAAVGRLETDRGLRQRLRRGGLETAAVHTEDRFNETVRGTIAAVAGRTP